MSNKLKAIIFVLAFVLIFVLTGKGEPKTKRIKVPSPMEIREFDPQPNNVMIVTYANDRRFLFQIDKIIPRSDCNQIRVDNNNRIILITQSISQAYEYILEPFPIMIDKWVHYKMRGFGS